jgi:predicted flap endonuclease-1-like 5' DNA nuclease
MQPQVPRQTLPGLSPIPAPMHPNAPDEESTVSTYTGGYPPPLPTSGGASAAGGPPPLPVSTTPTGDTQPLAPGGPHAPPPRSGGPPPPPVRLRSPESPGAGAPASSHRPPPPPSMRPHPPSLRPTLSGNLPPPTGVGPSSVPPRTVPSNSVHVSPEQRALQLSNQLVQMRQDLASSHADLRNARSERDSLRAELGRARARIDELEAAVGATPEPSAPATLIDPDVEQRLRGRINELEAALSKARSASAPPPPPPAAAGEDLKVVRGIGPKFEKMLKAEGITHVQQIAEWTEADAEAIARKIGVKLERIRREDWINSARRALESA